MPGPPSTSVNDKQTNSFIDNLDGTFTRRTSSLTNAQVAGNQWNSIGNSGTATSPGANAIVASVTVPAGQGGYYDVAVLWGYGNTAESTTSDNFGLYVNAVLQMKLSSAAAVNSLLTLPMLRLKLNATDVVSVQAIAAGSAGSTYKGSVAITRTA